MKKILQMQRRKKTDNLSIEIIIYIISVLTTLDIIVDSLFFITFILSGFTIVVLIIPNEFKSIYKNIVNKNIPKILGISFLVLGILTCLTPSKDVLYMISGVHYGSQLVEKAKNMPEFEKIRKLFNISLDNAIEQIEEARNNSKR